MLWWHDHCNCDTYSLGHGEGELREAAAEADPASRSAAEADPAAAARLGVAEKLARLSEEGGASCISQLVTTICTEEIIFVDVNATFVFFFRFLLMQPLLMS